MHEAQPAPAPRLLQHLPPQRLAARPAARRLQRAPRPDQRAPAPRGPRRRPRPPGAAPLAAAPAASGPPARAASAAAAGPRNRRATPAAASPPALSRPPASGPASSRYNTPPSRPPRADTSATKKGLPSDWRDRNGHEARGGEARPACRRPSRRRPPRRAGRSVQTLPLRRASSCCSGAVPDLFASLRADDQQAASAPACRRAAGTPGSPASARRPIAGRPGPAQHRPPASARAAEGLGQIAEQTQPRGAGRQLRPARVRLLARQAGQRRLVAGPAPCRAAQQALGLFQSALAAAVRHRPQHPVHRLQRGAARRRAPASVSPAGTHSPVMRRSPSAGRRARPPAPAASCRHRSRRSRIRPPVPARPGGAGSWVRGPSAEPAAGASPSGPAPSRCTCCNSSLSASSRPAKPGRYRYTRGAGPAAPSPAPRSCASASATSPALTSAIVNDDFDLSGTPPAPYRTTIARMKEGGLTGEFFSLYIKPVYVQNGGSARRTLDMIDSVYRAVQRHPRDLMIATSVADIQRAKRLGKIAALMGIEGGRRSRTLPTLREFYRLGVRYMTLTWNKQTTGPMLVAVRRSTMA